MSAADLDVCHGLPCDDPLDARGLKKRQQNPQRQQQEKKKPHQLWRRPGLGFPEYQLPDRDGGHGYEHGLRAVGEVVGKSLRQSQRRGVSIRCRPSVEMQISQKKVALLYFCGESKTNTAADGPFLGG